ncbi:MAG: ribonuclease Z [Oscillospiraceae bacterium]|nr:ribonuclease Z [Oscillospiraceae bacterium]
MTVVVCLDDNFGMAFGGRRLSRDSAVCADIVQMASDNAIAMHECSKMLFDGLDANISDDGDIHFVEFEAPNVLLEKADKLVLYRWNRRYPADLRFDAPLDSWHLAQTSEFAGSSHEKITKEVYVREHK